MHPNLEDIMKRLLCMSLSLLGIMLAAVGAHSSEVTLRLHQFLPLQAAIPANTIAPWIETVHEASGGRITIEHYPSMQLGGRAPELYGQVRNGVVDIIWTVLGYTPGLFPTAETFELPFMTGDATSGSVAFHRFMMENGEDEFKDVHPLAFHIHGPGVIHVKGEAVRNLDDLHGKKLRGPTRMITNLLGELGATPVGMPVPAVPESLAKGVIDGTVLPYEVTIPLKIAELTDGHTGFASYPGLYTATFALIMNKTRYAGLPDDLKAVIDAASGEKLARLAGQAMDDVDKVGLDIARRSGNAVVEIDDAAKARWQAASQPVVDNWIAEMNRKGLDGVGLVIKARAAIAAAN